MRSRKSIVLGLILMSLGGSWAAGETYNISTGSAAVTWPTGISPAIPETGLTADDIINVNSSIANGVVNFSGTSNNIAGTFNFLYTGDGAGTTFSIADTTAFENNTLTLSGNTSFNVGTDANATIFTKLTSDANSTTSSPYMFTKTGDGTLTILLNNKGQQNSMIASIVVEAGTLMLGNGVDSDATQGNPSFLGNVNNPILIKSGAKLILNAKRVMGDGMADITLEDNATVTVNYSNNELGKAHTLQLGNGSLINGSGFFNFRSGETIKLDVDGSAATAEISANCSIYDSSGTFNVGENDTLTFSGRIGANHNSSIKTGFVKNGTGTLALSNSGSSFQGPITINAGSIVDSCTTTSGNSSALGAGGLSYKNANNGETDTSYAYRNNDITVNAGGELTIAGSRGAGYHMGNVTLGASSGTAAGGKVILNGADINLGVGAAITLSNGSTVTGTGTWNLKSTDQTTVTVSSTWNPSTNKYDGAAKTLTVDSLGALTLGGATATATVDVANIAFQGTENYIAVTEADSTLTITSQIAGGTTNLTVSGAGTTTFNNSSSDFNNRLTVTGGATADLQSAHFYAGTKTDNSKIVVEANSAVKAASLAGMNLAGIQISGGTVELTGENAAWSTSAAPLSFTGVGATLNMSGANSSLTVDSVLAPGGNLNLNATASITVTASGQIADFPTAGENPAIATNLIKTGSAGLTLNSANTYTGSTSLTGGTTTLGAANALPTDTVLTVGTAAGDGTVLDLKGQNATVSNLTGFGGIINSSETACSLIVNVSGGETTVWTGNYSGTTGGISGNISLTVQGGGTFQSNGLNSFAGNLVIGENTTFIANLFAPDSDSATGLASNLIQVGKNGTLKYAQNRAQGNGASIELDEGARVLIDASDLSVAWGGSRYISLKNGSAVTSSNSSGYIQWRSGSTIKLLGENAVGYVGVNADGYDPNVVDTSKNFRIILGDGTEVFNVEKVSSVLYVSTPFENRTNAGVNKTGPGTVVLTNASHNMGSSTNTVTITDGTLQIGNDSTTGVLNGAYTLAASTDTKAATLAFNRSDESGYSFTNAITANNGATIANLGTANVAISSLTLGAGANLTIRQSGTGSIILPSNLVIADGQTITLDNQNAAAPLSASGFTGSGTIAVAQDSQPVRISTAETFTGSISVSDQAIAYLTGVYGTEATFDGDWAIDLSGYNNNPLLTLTETGTFDSTARIVPPTAGGYSEYYDLLSANLVALDSAFTVDPDGLVHGLLSTDVTDGKLFSDEYAWNVFAVKTGDSITGLKLQFDSAAVPEPSTWILLVLGLGVVAAVRRRRQAE